MTALDVLVQRQPVDEDALGDLVAAEAARLGVTARVTWVDDCTSPPGTGAVLVTVPETPDLAELPYGGAVRVDLGHRAPDLSPRLAHHIQGRGVDGVRWAVRTLVHHDRWQARRVAYGDEPEQFGELWLPDTPTRAPVVVLLHGGYWRSRWQLDLMDALAVDLAGRGFAAWNVEYRRPDRHGWPATVADVDAAVRYVAQLAATHPVDAGRVALVGHSAGGQLAPRAAADLLETTDAQVRPASVVVQAGVVDLHEAQRRDLGEGAVANALGGTCDELPDTYASASPLLRLPVGAHQLVVTARADSPDLNEMNRRYAAAAEVAGDAVTALHGDGDHFTLIAPESQLWADTAAVLAARLSP
ncbi:MAG: alpha/beta fold hydrolase [Streptosporangiales bacterium]|nr:alpha/beta fold hydrolase [Streptosporangiales bacterium]